LRAELIEHVAGPSNAPGVVQSQIIELAISDAYQLALFAERASTAGKLTPRERREENATRGRYEKTLARLRLQAAPAKPIGRTMADLRREAAERAPAA
jgi:hypothetical protein